MRVLTGVDLGGTKIEAACLDPSGAVLARRRTPTPQRDYDATVATVSRLVAETEAEAGGTCPVVGVGSPGSLSPESGLLRNSNSVVLNGRALDRDLVAALDRPVRLENDANCFAVAEARAGAGQGAGLVFGVIIGTGVGGGLAIDGRVRTGLNAIAGEWGHNPLPSKRGGELPGPACYCGRHGCIETWCAGPGLAADHARVTGQEMTAEQIVADGGPAAEATLARHRDRLARALAGVVNVLDPDVVVLGGGLSNLPGLAGHLAEAIRPHVFSDCVRTPIVQNRLGDSAGVIGAAWLTDGDMP